MIHGDFLKLRTKDWRDADVVFMNSTCFDESLMGKVAVVAGERGYPLLRFSVLVVWFACAFMAINKDFHVLLTLSIISFSVTQPA